MSDTLTSEIEEAVVISGPRRGRIVYLRPDQENAWSDEDLEQLTPQELALLNGALDKLIASVDKVGDSIRDATRRLGGPEQP